MKKTNLSLLVLTLGMTSISAFASSGEIEVKQSVNLENTIDLTITGEAAATISKQLTDNDVSFRRDPFSGALVQKGKGIRCIDQHGDKPLYCYVGITGSSVN